MIEKKTYLFLEYPKCSTCQKAKKWLQEHAIDFADRHMVEQNPKIEELQEWITRSQKESKRFFNTSGLKYKALGLKDKLPNMTEQEKLEVLASDGMLVKRPLLIGEDFVLIGFKEQEWKEQLDK